MRYLVVLLFFLFTVGTAQTQQFPHPHSKSVQPVLSQSLQWVSAPSAAGSSLPDAFFVNPEAWVFAPYSANTVLPTRTGLDVWLKFTLAATAAPQSWVIRIPSVTVEKVSLYNLSASDYRPVQSAGASIAHSAWTRNTRTPSFEGVTGNADKTFYLRLEHHSPVTERPELMSHADFADDASRVGTLLGAMLGMFGMLMLACVVAFGIARNTVFISLGAYVAAILLHYLVLMGLGGWRIWPDSEYLTLAMQQSAPFFAMATGCWFFAHASYGRGLSKPAYRLLCLVGLVSLGLGAFRLTSVDPIQHSYFNAWAAFVLLVTVAVMLWLNLRGVRENLGLLAGLAPIAVASALCLAYWYGWLGHNELVLVISIFLTLTGLAWLFVTLVWRSRAELLSSELAATLNNWDATSGLMQARVARTRLPRMIKRATRLKLSCGVIMLHWVNYEQLISTLSPEKQNAMLKHLGSVLNQVARDVDTAARLDNDHFMILLEGPISRSTLSWVSTQILTACIRASDDFGQPNSFNFHIAIWQATLVPISADEVIQALKTLLHQMSFGTKRPVQFVNSTASDLDRDTHEFNHRRDDVMAKINALEASVSGSDTLSPENP